MENNFTFGINYFEKFNSFWFSNNLKARFSGK